MIHEFVLQHPGIHLSSAMRSGNTDSKYPSLNEMPQKRENKPRFQTFFQKLKLFFHLIQKFHEYIIYI